MLGLLLSPAPSPPFIVEDAVVMGWWGGEMIPPVENTYDDIV
jgi:hypothetical protein